MTEDPYPREWLTERPHPRDPRLSDALIDYLPSAALRARIADLWRSYAAREPEATHTLLDLAADIAEDLTDDHRVIARVLWALLEQATTHMVGAIGEPLTVGRLDADVAAEREGALRAAAAL